jgi:putative ABC transport system permease protein
MWQDLRFGVRTLGKSPGFAAVAIIALALGIGANATVFSLVNAILFKSLPFPDSQRVQYVTSHNLKTPRAPDGLSEPEYNDLRAQLKSFTGLAGLSSERVNLSDDVNAPDSCGAAHITANAFSVLGLAPIVGRDFTPEDAKPGAPPVAILTNSLWQKRYDKDPTVIGKTIRVNSVPTTVVGISAPGLAIPPETELWTPYSSNSKENRNARDLQVFGKLAPGVSQKTAQTELAVAAQRFAAQYPDTNKEIRYRIENFNELTVKGGLKTVFLVLLGAVGFVLLIACANVANLLLSRAVGRSREISIRAALGAGRWRVVRQLLIESLLLSAAGGAIGLAIAQWGVRAFDAAVIPTGKPQWVNFSIDYRVFGYLATITLVTAILFGLAPALRLSRMDIISAIKAGGRGGMAMSGRRLSGALVVVEMTLAVVLLAGAGLMIRSFLAAYAMPVGVDTTNIMTMRVELPRTKYKSAAEQLQFQRRLVEHLRGLPGVKAAAVASGAFARGNATFPYELEGRPVDADHRKSANFLMAGEGYFEMLGLAARRGRVLIASDHVSGPNVAVVNETMARRLWPDQDPVGRRFHVFKDKVESDWITVVGVVPDYLQPAMNGEAAPVAIIPYRQEPSSWMIVMARTQGNAALLSNTFRREMQAVDPDLPVRDLVTLDGQLALSRWPLRIFGSMFAIFAVIALMLATVGLYAVVAYGVSQRTPEIGVRVALGASGGSILRLVLSTGLREALIGLLLGLAAATGVTRVLSGILVQVSPTDPVTYGAVGALLIGASILGCTVPARRAMRIDPVVALRHE